MKDKYLSERNKCFIANRKLVDHIDWTKEELVAVYFGTPTGKLQEQIQFELTIGTDSFR